MHKSGPHASHGAHRQTGERRRDKLQDLFPQRGTKATGKTDSERDKSKDHQPLNDDGDCATRSVRYVCGGVVRRLVLKAAFVPVHRLDPVLVKKLRRGSMVVPEMLARAVEAKPPGSKVAASEEDSNRFETPTVEARPIPMTVSRPSAPLICRAGQACKKLLRKTSERNRLEAVRKAKEDKNDVPVQECCGDASNNERSKFSSDASGSSHPPRKKRRRIVCLEDYDDVSDTPLDEYADDKVPENHASHSAALNMVTHKNATAKACRAINELKLKVETSQGQQSNKACQPSVTKDEKKRSPEAVTRSETATTAPEKHNAKTTVQPQSGGATACAVTTTKPSSKSIPALATGKDLIEKKAPKRLGTPSKDEGVKKPKPDSGAVKSNVSPCVDTVKKSSSQSPGVKVSPNKLLTNPVSHAKSSPKKHAASSDKCSTTKEASIPKSKPAAIAAKMGTANDGCSKGCGKDSLSVVKRALPDKLAQRPESSAKSSSNVFASNLGVSAKSLPVTTQKTINDKPQTKAAHHKQGSTAANNAFPNRLAQRTEPSAKSSSASQRNSTPAVPSSTSKTTKEAAQAKTGCGPNPTRQNTSSSTTKKVLLKIPKKLVFSEVLAMGDVAAVKKQTLAKAPTPSSKCVKNKVETKTGSSSGPDLQNKLVPSLNLAVERPTSCTESSDVSANSSSLVSIPRKLLAVTLKASKDSVPTISPPKKPAHCMNSNAAQASAPEKAAKVEKKIKSDLKSEHKKQSDGQPRTHSKERVADCTPNHSSQIKEGSKPDKVSAEKRLKSMAPSACATTAEAKISRSNLTSLPNVQTPTGNFVDSTEPPHSQRTNQQLSEPLEGTSSSQQTDRSVRTLPELDSSLPKACDVNLADGHRASLTPETINQAEATVATLSRDTLRSMETSAHGTACSEQKAQASDQPANNIVGSVSKETLLGNEGCRTHETSSAQNACSPKMQDPTAEVGDLLTDVVTVTQNLTYLADIGAEVECSGDYIAESRETVLKEDQSSLPKGSSNTTDGLPTSAESTPLNENRAELSKVAAEHSPLERKVESASQVFRNEAATPPCIDDAEGEKRVTSALNSPVPLTLEQTSAPSTEKQQCSISPANGSNSTMHAATGECELQEPAAKEHAHYVVTQSDSSAPILDEHNSQQEPLNLSSRSFPGSKPTAGMEEIRGSEESAAKSKGTEEEKVASTRELVVASELTTEVVESSDASSCTTSDESSYQHQRENVNDTLQEQQPTSQIPAGGDETSDKKEDCAAEQSSEHRAEELNSGVAQDTKVEDAAKVMDIDNCAHNKSRAHSQMDEQRSPPKDTQGCEATMPSTSSVCDEGSSTEMLDTLSLVSEDSVEEASLLDIAAGMPKPSRDSKKRKISRSAGTNTSLHSAWVFSRNRRGKRPRREKKRHRSQSSGEEHSGDTALASTSPETAAANNSVAADVSKLEAVSQIKKEPPAVSTQGPAAISSNARKPSCVPGGAQDPNTPSCKKLTAPTAAPCAMTESFMQAALLDLDMFTGLSILDVCGCSSAADLQELKARIVNQTITKNDAVDEIAQSVRTTIIEEYFKGQRAARNLQLLSKIPFSLEPTKVRRIRKLTQAVLEKVEPCTGLPL